MAGGKITDMMICETLISIDLDFDANMQQYYQLNYKSLAFANCWATDNTLFIADQKTYDFKITSNSCEYPCTGCPFITWKGTINQNWFLHKMIEDPMHNMIKMNYTIFIRPPPTNSASSSKQLS